MALARGTAAAGSGAACCGPKGRLAGAWRRRLPCAAAAAEAGCLRPVLAARQDGRGRGTRSRPPSGTALASSADPDVEVDAEAPQALGEQVKQLDAFLRPAAESPVRAVDEEAAVQLMQRLKRAGLAAGFGGANQVPKRLYSLEELKLNKISTEKLLSPKDVTLDGISKKLTVAAALGVGALAWGQHWDGNQLLGAAVAALLGLTLDQLAAGGGVSAMLLDAAGRALSPTYRGRVAAHEAGHFLIAYLLGLLPQAYTLSAVEAYQRYKAFNVQAGTLFCDKEFQIEAASGRISSSTLGRYTCVALAGVATEYLEFGVAEGGMGDVQQLDGLLRALNFSQAKADGEIRWAVLNTVTLLRRHAATHRKLADAMLAGASVGEAIVVVEESLAQEGTLA